MNKKTLAVIAKNFMIMLGVYAVQFILFPILLPDYYPRSDKASFIFFAAFIIGFIFGICFVSGKIKHWLIPDFLYGLLIFICSGRGLYGIGLYGVTLDGLQPTYDRLFALVSVAISLPFLFIIQMIIVFLKNILIKIFQRKNKY